GELIGAHLFVQPDPPTMYEDTISPEAEQLVMELLAKQPAKRPPSAKELGNRFARIAQAKGWVTNTNPVGVPENIVSGKHTQPGVEEQAQPSGHDVSFTPLPTDDAALVTGQPTTLSGAATSSIVDVPKRRRLWIGIIGVAAAASVTVGIVFAI